MCLMNLRPLEFYLNLTDITQVKKTVTYLQGSEAVMTVNDSSLVELTTDISVHSLSCHVSPEPTHLLTPWLTSGMRQGKKSHAQVDLPHTLVLPRLAEWVHPSQTLAQADRVRMKVTTQCLLCFKYRGEQICVCVWSGAMTVLCSDLNLKTQPQILAGSKCS